MTDDQSPTVRATIDTLTITAGKTAVSVVLEDPGVLEASLRDVAGPLPAGRVYPRSRDESLVRILDLAKYDVQRGEGVRLRPDLVQYVYADDGNVMGVAQTIGARMAVALEAHRVACADADTVLLDKLRTIATDFAPPPPETDTPEKP